MRLSQPFSQILKHELHYIYSKITNLQILLALIKKGVKDIKGRAAINDDNFTQFQIAQPFRVGEGETYNSHIKDEIAKMNENFVGDTQHTFQ